MAKDRYESVFRRALVLPDDSPVENLEYQGVAAWDSVGHMSLIAELESEFDISLEMDDVIDFDSFQAGKMILAKYNVVV